MTERSKRPTSEELFIEAFESGVRAQIQDVEEEEEDLVKLR